MDLQATDSAERHGPPSRGATQMRQQLRGVRMRKATSPLHGLNHTAPVRDRHRAQQFWTGRMQEGPGPLPSPDPLRRRDYGGLALFLLLLGTVAATALTKI